MVAYNFSTSNVIPYHFVQISEQTKKNEKSTLISC